MKRTRQQKRTAKQKADRGQTIAETKKREKLKQEQMTDKKVVS